MASTAQVSLEITILIFVLPPIYFNEDFYCARHKTIRQLAVNNDVCRVDFDEAWLRLFEDQVSSDEGPYNNITDVPNSTWKSFIRNMGRASFIEPFAVFPVSYLDNDLIVFDFKLLGTRICARKEKGK